MNITTTTITIGVGISLIIGGLLLIVQSSQESVGGETVIETTKIEKVPDTVTYYAQIDDTGEVLQVIVADEAFIKSGKVGDPSKWVETKMDGSIRGAYVGKGDRLDKQADIFIRENKVDLQQEMTRFRSPTSTLEI